jgi:hypothetical protein
LESSSALDFRKRDATMSLTNSRVDGLTGAGSPKRKASKGAAGAAGAVREGAGIE